MWLITTIAGIALAVILWNLRTAFYAKSEVFKENINISVKSREVELQDDYNELVTLIQEKKTSQNGKWFSMKDVDSLMTSSTEDK